jgi:polysaccharide transporter, PST family
LNVLYRFRKEEAMNKIFSYNYWHNLFTGSSNRKRLTKNFLSLTTLQALNYILPLITIPYLVRVLGPEKFGLVAFAQAFITYFVILTNYGFNYSATREISVNIKNKMKISKIYSAVMAAKIILGAVGFILMVFFIILIPKFRNDWAIYICTYAMILGDIVLPTWFFQGIEQMKYITFLNIVAKGIFTACIFIFVKKEADYLLVPLINSLGFIIAGFWSLKIVYKYFKMNIEKPTLSAIYDQLRKGAHIFISKMSTNLYTVSGTVILGLFTNNTIVGYYSAAEKLIKGIVQGVLAPISQTVYPYISRLAAESKQNALVFFKKIVKIVGTISLLISLVIFVYASAIVNVILGSQYQQSIIVLKILSFLPCIIGLGGIYTILFLLGFGYTKRWACIIITCGAINIVLVIVLVGVFSLAHIGASICWLFTEVCILIWSYQSYRGFTYVYK